MAKAEDKMKRLRSSAVCLFLFFSPFFFGLLLRLSVDDCKLCGFRFDLVEESLVCTPVFGRKQPAAAHKERYPQPAAVAQARTDCRPAMDVPRLAFSFDP